MRGRLAVGEKVTGVSVRDSLWLVVSLVFLAAPLLPTIGLPVFACFTMANLLHLRGVRVGAICPNWIRRAMLVFNLFCVYWNHGTFVGIEPGIAVFVALFCVKVLELRTRGEYQVTVGLGYFLLLCHLFITQELFPALYSGVGFFLLTATLLYFHSTGQTRPGQRPKRGLPLRPMGQMLLQTVPLVLLFFFFFPRLPQFGIQFFRKQTSGMTDRLSPGSVEEVQEDHSLAFRVRFLSPGPPPPAPHYWRGVVLWEAEGLEWNRGRSLPLASATLPWQQRNRLIEQEVVIEPHGNRWLLAFDRPYLGPQHSNLYSGHYLLSRAPINNRQLYRVFSGRLVDPLSAEERKAALHLPAEGISQRVIDLAKSWSGSPEELVWKAQAYFAENEYQYTLASGSYPGMDGWEMLDHFLFERKRGYCSHYAAAFAVLMRIAGVPARTVIGYAGGEHNPVGGFFSVYQSDAHAWSEVWLPEKGWVRIDPTMLIGRPDRAVGQVQAVDQQEAAEAFEADRSKAMETPFLKKVGYQWAALNYHWTRWVLGYDRETQREVLQRMGVRSRWSMVAVLMVSIAGVLVGIWLILRWQAARREDPLVRSWRLLCRKLERRSGVRRAPAQTPGQYGAAVVARRPELAPVVGPLVETYERLQYAPWTVDNLRRESARFRAAVRKV